MPTTEAGSRCPWPGARPYQASEADFFFGREREVAEVCRRVLSERLTILSGPAGLGKTSLLRAGVLVDLLHRRERGKANAEELQVPPILLLKNWGAQQADEAEDLLRSCLRRAIASLQHAIPGDPSLARSLLGDYELLQTAPTDRSLLGSVVNLCETTGGVILLFDHFEELLYGREESLARVMKAVTDLYRFEPRARLLLSIRDESLKDLHGLEPFVMGLLYRIYYLKPLTAITVEESILSSSRAAGIQLDRIAAARIVDWVMHASTRGLRQHGREPTETPEAKEHPAADLLCLQTVLREVFEFCLARSPDAKGVPGGTVIDLPALDSYRGGRALEVLIGEALERWIERSLAAQEVGGLGKPPGLISRLSEMQLSGAVRRAASRMGPFLSSGGFKTTVEEKDFMWGVIRNDLRALRPDLDYEAVRLLPTTRAARRLDRELLGLSKEHTEATTEGLSGFSRQERWSPADTADAIVQLFFGALARLQAGNVIKRVGIGTENNWELVHDGLGRPLTRWGEKWESSWEDAVYALTTSRGHAIGIDRRLGTAILRHMAWHGCTIRPLEDAILEAVVFDECDLRGTVFTGCTFAGASFRSCVLDGTTFIDCSFEPGADGTPVLFQHCVRAESLTFRKSQRIGAYSSVDGMRFDGCDLSGLVMEGLLLTGAVQFSSETRVYRAHFSGLKQSEDGNGVLEISKGCSLEFCAWDDKTERLMVDHGALMVNSGKRRHHTRWRGAIRPSRQP